MTTNPPRCILCATTMIIAEAGVDLWRCPRHPSVWYWQSARRYFSAVRCRRCDYAMTIGHYTLTCPGCGRQEDIEPDAPFWLLN